MLDQATHLTSPRLLAMTFIKCMPLHVFFRSTTCSRVYLHIEPPLTCLLVYYSCAVIIFFPTRRAPLAHAFLLHKICLLNISHFFSAYMRGSVRGGMREVAKACYIPYDTPLYNTQGVWLLFSGGTQQASLPAWYSVIQKLCPIVKSHHSWVSIQKTSRSRDRHAE